MPTARPLLLVRLVALLPFLFLSVPAACGGVWPSVPALLLLAWAAVPALLHLGLGEFDRAWLRWGLVGFDLAMLFLLNYVSIWQGGLPLYWPLYAVVSLELTVWWQWRGALVGGIASGGLLTILCCVLASSMGLVALAVVALAEGWGMVLAYFVQYGRQLQRGERCQRGPVERQGALAP